MDNVLILVVYYHCAKHNEILHAKYWN